MVKRVVNFARCCFVTLRYLAQYFDESIRKRKWYSRSADAHNKYSKVRRCRITLSDRDEPEIQDDDQLNRESTSDPVGH